MAIDPGTTAISLVSPLLGTMSSTSNQESLLEADSIISDDGRYILFDNESSDLIVGLLRQNNGDNLFRADRSAGTTTLLNDNGDGTTPWPKRVTAPTPTTYTCVFHCSFMSPASNPATRLDDCP
ncbi:MAG: hypothetical protein GY926_17765 [bacterium]|nr:hypothetical protein [bacterium]